MAEGTRLKELQEAQKRFDQVLQSESLKRAAAEQRNQEQFEHITKTLADLQLQLLNREQSHNDGSESILGGYGSTLGNQNGIVSNFVHSPLPRVEFPRFDGTNPRIWMIKCASYFKLMPSVPDAQRVHLAALHFDGKALL